MGTSKKNFWKKCVLAVLPALFLVSTVPAAGADLSGGTDIQIIAHRGGAALAPENTLAALETAVGCGADMAEIDVRMTGDGVLVAMHDESLERTTGICCPVCDAVWADIQKADAGKTFSPRFAGEQIPTLAECLSAAKGKIRLMVEIKCGKDQSKTLEETMAEIQKAGMEKDCVLGCRDVTILQKSKALSPELETVYIGPEDPEIFALSYVDSFSFPIKSLTAETVVRAGGKPVYAWTVNTPGEMEKALQCGASGLVTDDPALAIGFLVPPARWWSPACITTRTAP